MALASLVRKFSPSPMPMMSGRRARADHHVRLFRADDRNAICADDFAQCRTDRLCERVQLGFLAVKFS